MISVWNPLNVIPKQYEDELKKDHLVVVAFNILQVAVLMGKNHVLEMLMNEKQNKNPARTNDFVKYISKPSPCCNNVDRTWISAANTFHLAAKFNPEALYMILEKEPRLNSEEERKSFWEMVSEKDGFSPLHNSVTNMDALSTR